MGAIPFQRVRPSIGQGPVLFDGPWPTEKQISPVKAGLISFANGFSRFGLAYPLLGLGPSLEFRQPLRLDLDLGAGLGIPPFPARLLRHRELAETGEESGPV